ncbi:MAG: diguanylate cyclase [Clostridia bacterium]|nr:diguanylate cyclase [Clostridia bacterium]
MIFRLKLVLKRINDEYGHERCDMYIVCCCGIICGVFKRSPVFRIGGDEFVAILTGESYDNRDALMAELDRQLQQGQSAAEPWQRPSIAKGLATCEETDVAPDSVFVRADEAMYEDKRRMKGLSR